MSIRDESTLRVVLYEGDGAHPLTPENRYALVSSLLEKGYALSRATGLGRLAPADRSPLLVLGRFEGGQPPATDPSPVGTPTRIEFRDLANLNPAAIAETVETVRTDTGTARQGEWKPWFPVIDFDRCTNCMQCLSFCLFGVYGVDTSHRIQVQNNDNCKTNCPACSRVCPEAAIMFPKYKAGPINGDVVSDADLNREKMKIDISALLGGDVYSMLRERSDRAKSRFSKERDANKALNERQKCLTKLASDGDIPAEVLMNLPSPEEILRRAEEAKSRAQAALQAAGISSPPPA